MVHLTGNILLRKVILQLKLELKLKALGGNLKRLTKRFMPLKLAVKFARDPITLKIVPIRMKLKLIKKRATPNSGIHILKVNLEPLLPDTIKGIMGTLRSKNEDNLLKKR